METPGWPELEEKVREGSQVSWMLELRESEVRKLEEQPCKTLPGSLKDAVQEKAVVSGSECRSATCGRRKRWGRMREATICRGSGELERQIGAEVERGWDGGCARLVEGRRTPEEGSEAKL